MKGRNIAGLLLAFSCLLFLGYVTYSFLASSSNDERRHYDAAESELIVTNLSTSAFILFRSDTTPAALAMPERDIWLRPGNYFVEYTQSGRSFFLPVPLTGFRSGPDKEGAFVVTIRPGPAEFPPHLSQSQPFEFIPGGNFLFGDKKNPGEQHYVWLTSYFVAPFEVTNEEFRLFLADPNGYSNPLNWSKEGNRWRAEIKSHSSADLVPSLPEYQRFGSPDQPVTRVTWYEARAFCIWLTRTIGGKHWLYELPTEAEWEKAARGPDNFDYALGMTISDNEVGDYNWKKNPWEPVTVAGIEATRSKYRPNRFRLFHMTGNVVEWTQSVNRSFSSKNPYNNDDERNHDGTPGLRVARGGSWYSASIAYLYIPYRDAFQPEHSSQDIGFRVVARLIP